MTPADGKEQPFYYDGRSIDEFIAREEGRDPYANTKRKKENKTVLESADYKNEEPDNPGNQPPSPSYVKPAA